MPPALPQHAPVQLRLGFSHTLRSCAACLCRDARALKGIRSLRLPSIAGDSTCGACSSGFYALPNNAQFTNGIYPTSQVGLCMCPPSLLSSFGRLKRRAGPVLTMHTSAGAFIPPHGPCKRVRCGGGHGSAADVQGLCRLR